MKKVCFSCIILFFSTVFPGFSLGAGDFTFNPSLQFRGEYDDNITFANSDAKSDWLGVFIPSMQAAWQTPRLDISGTAEAEIRRFASENQYNDEYQRYTITSAYQLSERLALDAGGSYNRDSTLESELEETGIVENLYRRERFTLNGGARYQLSELLFSSFEYSYGNTRYKGPGNTDYDSHSLVGSLNYRFRNQRDQLFLQPSYYRYKSDVSTVDNYGLSLGWSRAISEKLTLSSYLGLRYTDSDYYYTTYVPTFDATSGMFFWQLKKMTINKGDVGGTADISLSGRNETLHYRLNYNRDLTYTSTGSPIDRDRFTGSIDWAISPRLSGGFGAGLYFSKSNDDYSSEDSSYYYLHPRISYQLLKNHQLQLHYLYAHTTDKTLTENDSYERNRVWLALVFNFPKLLD
ncbi:MAG: outer membrane beta-barrel protein [Deltaproteobacteria bacterium]|nr:outer membrane beta-barrel protein [Deltaproteobacteria bacterium]